MISPGMVLRAESAAAVGCWLQRWSGGGGGGESSEGRQMRQLLVLHKDSNPVDSKNNCKNSAYRAYT